jgi:hypothetical protein
MCILASNKHIPQQNIWLNHVDSPSGKYIAEIEPAKGMIQPEKNP